MLLCLLMISKSVLFCYSKWEEIGLKLIFFFFRVCLQKHSLAVSEIFATVTRGGTSSWCETWQWTVWSRKTISFPLPMTRGHLMVIERQFDSSGGLTCSHGNYLLYISTYNFNDPAGCLIECERCSADKN